MRSSFDIESLGLNSIPNPINSDQFRFVSDQKKIAFDPHFSVDDQSGFNKKNHMAHGFEIAGPREKIFFNPSQSRVFIVSCGGLCPGINGVIRALVMQLWYRYGCQKIWGVRYGYQGLSAQSPDPLVSLHPDELTHIHETGGSFLGSSRGSPEPEEMADFLIEHQVNILFTIGGDGTQRGAMAILSECRKKSWPISVIGIPKTVDNDIAYVRQSFGFETAVSVACQALRSAHNEARGYQNGIGLVRLMGRHSGYIAATATLAAGHVSFCLIPEVPFYLHGDGGLLSLLEKQLKERNHALVVVAEGAGQHYFSDMKVARDASGNIKLGNTGTYLHEKIVEHFNSTGSPVSMKYIDPSYMIRSAAANPADQLFCARLAQNAVHAAMAGKTGMVIGYWHGSMTHVPFQALGDYRQAVSPAGNLWFNVLETTGQPHKIGHPV